jgi:hypothetical protein
MKAARRAKVIPGAPNGLSSRRLAREWKALNALVRIYNRLLPPRANRLQRDELLDYTRERFLACPFGLAKPLCTNCGFHCFEPARRAQLQAAVSRALPHLCWRHPWLSTCLWAYGLHTTPSLAARLDYPSWGTE